MKKVLLIMLSLFLLTSCESKTMKMSSSSMEPTFKKGASVVINLTAYNKESPKRWEIAVYQGQNDKLWIHRIVGLPGENLIINPDGIYINGARLPKPDYLSHVSFVPEEMLLNKDAPPPYKEYKIPNDSYFLLGDNSEKSYDSRMVGPISIDKIKGRVQQ